MHSMKSTTRYNQLNLEEIPTNYDGREISIVLRKSPSLRWKIFHGIHSMLGGLFLIAGSCMYYAEVTRLYSMAPTAGGWFFSIGSFFLLLADLQEWWYHQYNCSSNHTAESVYTMTIDDEFQGLDSLGVGQLKRVNNGWNNIMAACGSACYVAGSVLLIPVFEKYETIGNWLIIAGSVLIFLSSLWKIHRTGRINTSNSSDHRFHSGNIFSDICALCINVSVGLGGVCYFLGIMYILAGFSMNDFGMNLSATFCVMGGISFFLASLFLQFRYYCRK